MTVLQPPYAYYGGKRRVAAEVWRRLGDVDAYTEPFLGAGAVFLARPEPRGMETINDIDGLVVNFWRAVQGAPDRVLESFRGLLSETDFGARGRAILCHAEILPDKLGEDPCHFDPCIAGWWAYCVCLSVGGFVPGSPANRIHLGRWSGMLALDRAGSLLEYLHALQHRLQGVRVLCGDWSRAVGSAATTFHGLAGVFLDPPYGVQDRSRCYRMDDRNLSQKVGNWCLEHGTDTRFRIAVCGYEGEYDLTGWDVVAWSANGGQGSTAGRGQQNRGRERVWFSPGCIGKTLFDGEVCDDRGSEDNQGRDDGSAGSDLQALRGSNDPGNVIDGGPGVGLPHVSDVPENLG